MFRHRADFDREEAERRDRRVLEACGYEFESICKEVHTDVLADRVKRKNSIYEKGVIYGNEAIDTE